MEDEQKQLVEYEPPVEMPEKQPKRAKKVVRVNVISRHGSAALVEFVEGQAVQRKTVSAGLLDGEKISQDDLDMGVPYGLPWADLFKINVTPKVIEKALHNAGVWTLEDLLGNPRRVIAALQSAYGVDIAALIRAASEYLAK